jgi:hypothetical protein
MVCCYMRLLGSAEAMLGGIIGLPFEPAIKFRNGPVAVIRVDVAQDSVNLLFDTVATFLRLRRSEMQKERETPDLPKELQEFRLPILEGVPRRLDEIIRNVNRLIMGKLLIRIGEPSEHPVPEQCPSSENTNNPSVS